MNKDIYLFTNKEKEKIKELAKDCDRHFLSCDKERNDTGENHD